MRVNPAAGQLKGVFDEDARQARLLAVPVDEALANLFPVGLGTFEEGVDEFRGACILARLHSGFRPGLLGIFQPRENLDFGYHCRLRG